MRQSCQEIISSLSLQNLSPKEWAAKIRFIKNTIIGNNYKKKEFKEFGLIPK